MLKEGSSDPIEIPEFAHDCHTRKGKKAGKTKRDFIKEEFQSLSPREPGLTDADVERLLA